VFVAPLGEAAFHKAVTIVSELRRAGVATLMDFEHRSLKSSMKLADKVGAQLVLILGETELQTGQWALRSMKDSSQTTISAENWLSGIQKALNC
ncbi:MAG TPA: His/Gly/Thr/Pro-type tRNA ligase C-terminal domain-containing protein, partial [Acidobacteriota bacterium]|nr:His/Gly/Thr/Pro-type tRNA ligase C-terminal domain-containing protein [Acidobacteriota bacterium]